MNKKECYCTLAYKKYIKRGNKIYGPYYYESYRDEKGEVRKKYLGASVKKSNFYLILFLIILFGLVSLFVLRFYLNISAVEGIAELVNSFVNPQRVQFEPECGNGICEKGEIGICPEDCAIWEGSCLADVNHDGKINLIDVNYVSLYESLGEPCSFYNDTEIDWCKFTDITRDGEVNQLDYEIVSYVWVSGGTCDRSIGPELCDGYDNDNDTETDEGGVCPVCGNNWCETSEDEVTCSLDCLSVFCQDNDNDGYNATSGEVCGTTADCDDTNENVNPAASEICNDIDDNCDGEVDESQLGDIGFCDKSSLRPLDASNNLFTEEELTAYFDTHYFDMNEIYSRNNSLNWSLTPPIVDINGDGIPDDLNGDGQPDCVSRQYNLYGTAFALITMFEATGNITYLDEVRLIADNMISISSDYDASWAVPYDTQRFMNWANQWTAEHGPLKFWNASRCANDSQGNPIIYYRFQLNELQGMRIISRLARVMKEYHVEGWEPYYNFAAQSISFYAMLGADSQHPNGNPLIDSAIDKRTHYIQNALDLYHVGGDYNFLSWAQIIALDIESNYIIPNNNYLFVDISPTIPGPYDTSHANRVADLFAQTTRDEMFFTSGELLKITNTFLFRVWESNPNIELSSNYPYPNLFRNYIDGTNPCIGTNIPPYRLGTVGFGWNYLGRYDSRANKILQNLTRNLINNELIQNFPAGGSCEGGNNLNYNYVTNFIAETLYEMELSNDCNNGLCEEGETFENCFGDCTVWNASCLADINRDNVINETDNSILFNQLFAVCSYGGNPVTDWCSWADINRDGVADWDDVNILSLNFGVECIPERGPELCDGYDNDNDSMVDEGIACMICGNGVCEFGESCSICSNDCGECPLPPGDGGGGGGENGGSGGSSFAGFLFNNQSCSELWQCGSWGDCQNGTRTRLCYDVHACETFDYQPQLEEFCGEQFISSEDLFLIYGNVRWDIVLAVVVSFLGLSGIIVSFVIMILRRQNIRKRRQELLRGVARVQ